MQETAFYIMAFADKLFREFAKGTKCPTDKGTKCPTPTLPTNNGLTTQTETSVGGTSVGGTSVGGTSVGGTSVGGTSVGGTSVGGTSVGGTSVGGDYTSVVKVQKKANITTENIGQLFLMQIPGISSAIASEIMKPFKTFLEFVEHVKQNPTYLENIKLESNGKLRKIGSNVVKSIQTFIFGL